MATQDSAEIAAPRSTTAPRAPLGLQLTRIRRQRPELATFEELDRNAVRRVREIESRRPRTEMLHLEESACDRCALVGVLVRHLSELRDAKPEPDRATFPFASGSGRKASRQLLTPWIGPFCCISSPDEYGEPGACTDEQSASGDS